MFCNTTTALASSPPLRVDPRPPYPLIWSPRHSGPIQHNGFALIDIFSPCVTYNHDNDTPFFKSRVKKLEDEEHDKTDWKSACEKAMLWGDTIYTGLFYQKEGAPSLGDLEPVLDEGGPLAFRPLGLGEEQAQKIINKMM